MDTMLQYPTKWNLDSLYKNIEEWESDFGLWEDCLKKFTTYVNKLEDEAMFVSYIQLQVEFEQKFNKFYMYPRLLKDLDLSNREYEKLTQRMSATGMKYVEDLSLLSTQMQELPEELVRGWIKTNPEISHLDLWYDGIVRSKPYILSEAEERLLGLNNFGNHSTVYRVLTQSEIEFPMVLGEDDKTEVKANPTNLRSALASTNKEYRERIWNGCLNTFSKYNQTLSNLYLGNVKQTAYYTKVRNKKSSRWSALFSNDIPESVYESLIDSARKSLPAIHEYFDLKSEVFGYKLSYYDKQAPIQQHVDRKEYTFEEGVDMILDAFSILGSQYVADVRHAIEMGRVDVYPDENKVTGAYSLGGSVKGDHPFVLMNWTGTLEDVFTLAHEIGHSMHSYYSTENQIWPYKHYPIFTAEVASITNENILFSHLINSEILTNEEKITLIDSKITDIESTFFRQVKFSEFEDWVHTKIDNNEAVSSQDLNDQYLQLVKDYYGPALNIPDDNTVACEWSRIPHFYRDYYVYQYATGIAAAEKMNTILQETGNPNHILNFLKSGESKLPIDTLREAGVDMENPDTVDAIGDTVRGLTNTLRDLLQKKS